MQGRSLGETVHISNAGEVNKSEDPFSTRRVVVSCIARNENGSTGIKVARRPDAGLTHA